jgi:uncharacterized membrane protein YhaH (DUF805 family)
MNWICHKCGAQNGSVSGICGSCFEMRSPNAQLVESAEEKAVASYANQPAPTFFERYFSLAHRFTRRDFAAVFSLCILAFILTRWMIARFEEPFIPLLGYACLVSTVAVITIAAAKRGRDLDVKPLWSIFFAGSTFGLIGLLFFAGTRGPNQYGADPRKPKQG